MKIKITKIPDNLTKFPRQNAAKWHHATGGPLPTSTGIDGMTVYGNGGIHETNPAGGVRIGNKGLVEQGEVRVGNYIFSNRLK